MPHQNAEEGRLRQALRQHGLRVLILLVVCVFFVLRWLTLRGTFHVVAALGFGLVALVAVVEAFWGKRIFLLDRLLTAQRQTVVANVGISLVFLDLVFARTDWSSTLDALTNANYWMLIPSFALVGVSMLIRTWRWQWLLRPVGRVPFGPALRAILIGIGANMILPARAGEFLRAYVLGRSTGYSKTAVFATLVVERILDGLTILLFLLSVVLVIGTRSPEIQHIGLLGGAFYLAALGVVLLFYFRQSWFLGLMERLLPQAWKAPVLDLMKSFLNGLHVFRDGKQLLVVCCQSVIAWLAIAWSFYPILLAFDFGAPVPLFAPFLLTPLLALGLTIPGAPGGIGIEQYMAVLALRLSFTAVGARVATDFAEQAAAFSVLTHLSQAIPEIALGAWAFVAEGLTWGEVESQRTT